MAIKHNYEEEKKKIQTPQYLVERLDLMATPEHCRELQEYLSKRHAEGYRLTHALPTNPLEFVLIFEKI